MFVGNCSARQFWTGDLNLTICFENFLCIVCAVAATDQLMDAFPSARGLISSAKGRIVSPPYLEVWMISVVLNAPQFRTKTNLFGIPLTRSTQCCLLSVLHFICRSLKG